MKPTTIKAIGLQGRPFNHEIEPATIIAGDNGSGKTAITRALKIGLLGYDPALGKKPMATFQACSGDRLEIEVELGDNTGTFRDRIRRTWQKKGAALKSDHDLGGQQELGDFLHPAVLDFSQFLQAKPAERQRILEALIGDGGDVEQAITDRLLSVPDHLDGPFKHLESYQAAEAAAADQARALKQEVDRLEKALQQVEVEDAEAPQTVDYSADAHKLLRAAVDDLSRELGGKQSLALKITEARQNAPEQPGAPCPTPEQIAEAEHYLADQEAIAQNRAKIESQNREIQTRLDALVKEAARLAGDGEKKQPADPRPDPEAWAASVKACHQVDHQRAEAQGRLTAVRRVLEGLQFDRDAKVGELDGCPSCPTCHQKAPAGTDLAALVAEGYQVRIDKAAAEVKAADAELKRIIDEQDIALSEQRALDELLAGWKAHDRYLEAEALQPEIDELRGALITELEGDDIAGARQRLVQLRELRGDWKVFEAANVPSSEDEAAALGELNRCKEQHRLKAEELLQMDRLRELAHAGATREKQRTNLTGELDRQKADLQIVTELREWAKASSLEDTAGRLARLLEPACHVLAGVIEGTLAVQGTDVGIDPGDGSLRPLEVLSGAEAAAVAVAIQAALASQGPVKTVIVDELSRFTRPRRKRLLSNLTGLIAWGTLESFVAIDHDRRAVDDYADSHDPSVALTIIDLEGGAE